MTPEENLHIKSLKDRPDIFNYVVDHFLRQGRMSVDDQGYCAYRGSDGAMCAVGCLIADDEYDPSFEGKDIIYLTNVYLRSGFASRIKNTDALVMLSDLQGLHDNHLQYDDDGISEDTKLRIDDLRKKWNIK